MEAPYPSKNYCLTVLAQDLCYSDPFSSVCAVSDPSQVRDDLSLACSTVSICMYHASMRVGCNRTDRSTIRQLFKFVFVRLRSFCNVMLHVGGPALFTSACVVASIYVYASKWHNLAVARPETQAPGPKPGRRRPSPSILQSLKSLKSLGLKRFALLSS